MEATYELTDNAAKKQYEFNIDGLIPKIEYIKTRNGEIYLTHTEVPIGLEGRGIGANLVRQVLEDVELQKLALVPQCPFVAGYIRRHPEWKRLLKAGIHID